MKGLWGWHREQGRGWAKIQRDPRWEREGSPGKASVGTRGVHLESKPESLQWKSEMAALLTPSMLILLSSLPVIFLSVFVEYLIVFQALLAPETQRRNRHHVTCAFGENSCLS